MWYAWQGSNLRPFAPEEHAKRSLKSFRFNIASFLRSLEIVEMFQNCSRIASLRTRCSRIPIVLIRAAVKLRQGLAHHGEFGLAVPLECVGVALPQHLGHK